ncbi:hypothetical protein C7I36_01605 [Zobellella taiwanensis]|uniref:Uncharacterized protein n=2 Tax=Zobellella taiwanensis TaxID=347535 RepID=A0A2P7RA21_9GAMM|nr:hypothetical protein C7I36_01605 [Zobellella taiwanensis]
MYIWQHNDWPHFRWDETSLKPRLDEIRWLQGRLLGRTEVAPAQTDSAVEMDALIQNAIRTSEIEGEHLDVGSVRSSVARQLGLEQAGMAGRPTPETDSLVALLLEATHQPEQPLSCEQLCRWQAQLFPVQGMFSRIVMGGLRGEHPMQVISGRMDNPTVHFEAPPRQGLEQQLNAFIDWFNHPPAQLDAILRAGIAHLWLITLHPFDDGNGRVTRAVTDRALAQAEARSVRFYSLSAAIMARRNGYYDHLEQTQKGNLDITIWLAWFLDTLQEALQQALARVDRVLEKTRFWQRHAKTPLSERQIKVLNRLLDNAGEEFESGINTRKYQALAKVSKATATRDLADLVEKGCLHSLPGGGRSTRYGLAYGKSNNMNTYPIGTPGTPWGEAERAQWLALQRRQRSYKNEVLAAIERLTSRFEVQQYGELTVGDERFPLMAIHSRDWREELPVVLVTGGVHGYETSGVHGALQFVEQHGEHYAGRVNWLVAPCVSPWAYERIQRWNANAVDPNRSFTANSPAPESAALMQLVAPVRERVLLHIDLHETTDTDESEFRPALAARDGKPFTPCGIPDGFYLVDDSENPQPAFQQAVIAAVEKVTHIAPADDQGEIIGSPVVANGVIEYPLTALGLCAGMTPARYKTTTEVYPNSPRATAEQCNAAQVAAVCAAIDYALAQPHPQPRK